MTKKQETKDGLTKEQEAKIPYYLDMYTKIGLDCSPIRREHAEEAVKALYKYQKYAPIKEFFWVNDPFEACELAAKFAYSPDPVSAMKYTPTYAQIAEQASKASYGSFEAYWVAFYDFVQTELPVPPHELVDICKNIVKECGIFFTFENYVIMVPKPKAIRLKNEKLHSDGDQMALEYPNGRGIYAKEGKIYPTLLAMKMAEKQGE